MAQSNRENLSTAVLLLKLAVFTVAVPGTVTVWLPLYYVYPDIRPWPAQWTATEAGALLLIALGFAGYMWCALDFAFAGRGTPAPIDPPKVVVVRGLYGYARNPMYISVLAVLLGESLLLKSSRLLGYAAIVAVAFHLFVLLYEEPTLRHKMGDSYEQYCKITPRWIPRVAGKQ